MPDEADAVTFTTSLVLSPITFTSPWTSSGDMFTPRAFRSLDVSTATALEATRSVLSWAR